MSFKGAILIATFFFLLTPIVSGQTSSSEIKFRASHISIDDLLRSWRDQSDRILVFSLDRIPAIQIELPQKNLTEQQIISLLKTQNLNVLVRDNRILITQVKAQPKKRYSLSGYVTDAATGEALIGATVFEKGSKLGTVTNRYGYYSLTIPADSSDFEVNFIGYEKRSLKVTLASDQKLDFELNENALELGEVTISSRTPDFNIRSMIPGINSLDFGPENNVPYFMGEVDVFQGSLLLPGIKILGEEAAGINVRGGGIDENLILLDEAPIYNPTHYFGLISVFNPEAVNDIQFMKGFFPANFGGRASSVITIHQKEGNDQAFHMAGGLGLLSARLLAEGPIKRGKSSFLVSGRQSLLNPTELGASDINNSSTFFTDFNFKANWRQNDHNTFFLSGYVGNDRNVTGFDGQRRWGNQTATFRWNRQYGQKLFSHFSAVFSQYNYRIVEPREAGSFIGRFRIIDYTLKLDQSYHASPTSEFNFGAITTFHRLKPGERLPFDPDDTSTNPLDLDSEHGIETGLYGSHRWSINNEISVLYGLRISALHNIGPSQVYTYAEGEPLSDQSIIDTLQVEPGQIISSFYNLEPRISTNWRFEPSTSIKASYNRTYQYIHLISNTITPNPTDIWKLSDEFLAPTRTDHFSIGLFKNFNDNAWESYVDVFYKDIRNTIEYKNGADLLFNENIETELIKADARAYGLEFFLKRNLGNITGWISYTLSRAERRTITDFPEEQINDGSYFPDDNDKTHDVSLVVLNRLSSRLSFSSSFNYSTGRPITLPTGKYTFEGNPIPHFSGRNQSRITDYHRLDLSLKLEGKKSRKDGTPRKFNDYWTLTVYNVYARRNAFSYFFRASESDPSETEIVRYSVFGTVIPSITYNFSF